MIPPPLVVPVYACVVLIVACWLLSIVTKNYSQVDRLWSIAPSLYLGYFAAASRFADLRVDLMFVLSLLWGARLTYNFARKGGYAWRNEDYRWAVLREKLGPVGFQLFNATFIAPFQNALLFALTLPAAVSLVAGSGFATRPLTWMDALFACAFLGFLAGETIADNQQWRFHVDKDRRRAAGEPIVEPFLRHGLFAYSRHPNFFCEISMWWCMYGFAVAATGAWLNWTIVGALVLTALFQGSTTMTEGLTREKYPSYAEYQRTTSRLIPLPPTKT